MSSSPVAVPEPSSLKDMLELRRELRDLTMDEFTRLNTMTKELAEKVDKIRSEDLPKVRSDLGLLQAKQGTLAVITAVAAAIGAGGVAAIHFLLTR